MQIFITNVTILILLVCGLVSEIRAQKGCEKIDKSRPSVYIALEKNYDETVKGKSTKKTELRLTNNTSCNIYLETTDNDKELPNGKLYKAESRKMEDGMTEIRYTQLPVDGLVKYIFYDIQKTPKSNWTPANYDEFRDLVFHYTVFPSLSVIFSTEKKHSQKPFRVSVPFTYQWEDSSFENVKHRTFYWYELPKGFGDTSQAD